MAQFCEYCGRQIDDGGECDCPGAVAAREREAMERKAEAVTGGASVNDQAADAPAANEAGGASAADQAQTENVSGQEEKAQAPKSKAADILGTTGAEVASDLKSLCMGMFTDPIETLRENAARCDHTSSYIIVAVLSVFTFIVIAVMGDTPLINQAIGRGTLVVFSLVAAVAIFAFKAVYAACITVWGKKYEPGLSYSDSLATLCLLGIYDIVMLAAFTFFMALSIFELGIAILFFWFIVTAVEGIVSSWVLTEGNAGSVIRFNLILLFVLIVLIVLSMRGIVMDMFTGALIVVMNTLAGF